MISIHATKQDIGQEDEHHGTLTSLKAACALPVGSGGRNLLIQATSKKKKKPGKCT